jgi:thioesterase domain-containing protein
MFFLQWFEEYASASPDALAITCEGRQLTELGCNPEPANAWAGKILGGCDTRLLPGTHRSILTRPQVTTLAQEIRQRLLPNVPAPATSVVA